ncbi:hypothetical protein [Dickeya fangzhongdai]|uniref:hypothetical protein n=1 Tax=Dickeya fangzhongdai TaxID=1778540 RepID=UPI00142E09A3|nr:hypothetical protein [Dickeya fangzhongdai]WOY02505.1 hypothetical protein OGM22_17055 [Dickeya fangzhongdai]
MKTQSAAGQDKLLPLIVGNADYIIIQDLSYLHRISPENRNGQNVNTADGEVIRLHTIAALMFCPPNGNKPYAMSKNYHPLFLASIAPLTGGRIYFLFVTRVLFSRLSERRQKKTYASA